MEPAKKLALFEQTVVPHLNAAYNLSRWLTRNDHDAEDLVQESYLKAFRAFETFEGRGANEARAWLLTVVRNTCFTWLKRQRGRSRTEFNEEIHSGGDAPEDAERVLLNGAAMGALNQCIEKLPTEFRETIVLREIEELSYQEISGIISVPVGTVMSRLSRARKRLQDCMMGAVR